MQERYDVVVIGAGQAGLSLGYHLARQGISFLVVDAGARVGDAWRNRWDSLRLFSPARFDGLDGMPFPAPPHHFPTKDEMADYLEAYARRFALPVRTGFRVERLSRRGDAYLVRAGDGELQAAQVAVAMADYQRPRTPAFSRELAPSIVQLHAAAYRNPTALPPGPVLIAGAGNSGAELALELARTGRPVWIAGRDVGQVPFRMASRAARHVLAPLTFRVAFHRVLTLATPMGRRAHAHFRSAPLIRTRLTDLAAAGVQHVPSVVGVRDGRPVLEDGRRLDPATVLWCTGYEPGFSWIDLPVLDAQGRPCHRRGVVPGEPGLYFLGLHFLYAMSSAMIHGVGRDAAFLAHAIAARAAAHAPARGEAPTAATPAPDAA